MTSFPTRVRGNAVYKEQLRQLASRRSTSVTELIREALDSCFGLELSEMHDTAIFVVEGGSLKNQKVTKAPLVSEQAS